MSIKELRKKLQSEKIKNRERPWGYYVLERWPSIYFTLVVASTSLKPNQITLAGIFLGIIGSAIIFFSLSTTGLLAGIILVYLSILLDKVDGELARYKKQFSLKGIYLDEIAHLIIPPLFMLAMVFRIKPPVLLLFSGFGIFGMLAAVSLPILRASHNLKYHIFLKKYVKNKDLFNLPNITPTDDFQEFRQKYSLFYAPLRILHQLQYFTHIVLIFFILAILGGPAGLFELHAASTWFIMILGIILPLFVLENAIKGYLSIEKQIKSLETDKTDKFPKLDK